MPQSFPVTTGFKTRRRVLAANSPTWCWSENACPVGRPCGQAGRPVPGHPQEGFETCLISFDETTQRITGHHRAVCVGAERCLLNQRTCLASRFVQEANIDESSESVASRTLATHGIAALCST
jgi:hypothetical protein